jgi:(p)ppGpp synthase/HD superfamily hydrolase
MKKGGGMISELEMRAIIFASKKHASINHKRKYSQEDYINHPRRVANMVRDAESATIEMLAASWLHDTVEDTDTTLGEIFELFGRDVADLVEMLTDVAKPEDGNRSVRVKINLDHTKQSSPEAQTIKLADLIDNSISIFDNDKSFSKVYANEKREMMSFLKQGDEVLFGRCSQILQDYFNNKNKMELKKTYPHYL